jgi:large subunit ribosomal protein L10
MPSAKILSEKQAYVAELKAKFDNAVSGCVVAYGGINVENDTKLRKELREAGVDYMVVKNTMLRLAVKGSSIEGLTETFTGDTAVAFANESDPMAAARILCKYQDGDKSKKFVVKAGFMEGKVMSAAETNAIAKLPGREGMLSMFAGALTSTLSGLAVAMQAYVDKQNEQETPAA